MENHIRATFMSLIPIPLLILILTVLYLRWRFQRRLIRDRDVTLVSQVEQEGTSADAARSTSDTERDYEGHAESDQDFQSPQSTEANLKPGKPRALRVTCDSVELEWTKPEKGAHNIASYTIFYRSTGDPSDQWIEQKTNTVEEKTTVLQLLENNAYLFKVRPELKNGECSPESDESEPTQTTITIPTKPDKPKALSITHDSVELEWSKPEQGAHNVTSYTIFYRSTSDPLDQWMLRQTETAEERAIVSQLSEKSTYFFKIRPESMSKELSQESDKSEPIQTTMIVPSKPGRPKALSITYNSVELEWSEPERGAHNITSYTILYRSTSDPSDQWMLHQTETAEERAIVAQLSEKSTYFFKVRPESISEELSQESDESEPIQTTVIVPSKPGQPKALSTTHNGIELEWSKPERGAHNITSYTIFYRSASDPSDQWMLHQTETPEERATVTQLSEKNTYFFKVRPESTSEELSQESDESEPIQTTVIVPSKPGQPKALSITHNGIELEWSKPERGAHNITSYTIFYRSTSDPSDQWMLHRTETAEERAIVAQLSEKTTYFFRVRPESISEELSQESDESEPIQTIVIVPSKPGQPKALSTTHNGIELEWSKPERGAHNITSYTIFYRSASDPSDQWMLHQTETPEERATVTQLSEKTTYFFKVRPESISEELSQESDESEPIQTTVIVPSKPSQPKALSTTHNGIELEWSKPERGAHNITSYTIFYRSASDPSDQWMLHQTETPEERATVTQLSEKNTYFFKVRSESTSEELSQESDESEPIQTTVIVPSKPGQPKALSTTHNGIELEWSKPERGAHNITSYTIFYHSTSDPSDQWMLHRTETAEERAIVAQLSEKTTYFFKVRPESISEELSQESDESEPIQTTVIVPSKPGQPKALSTTHNGIELEWSKPERGAHNITSYTIFYRSASDPSDQWMLHQTETPEERATVTQLSEKNTYFFKVRPESISEELSQESDESEPIQTTVIVPSKPGQPKALSITYNSVELEWSKPERGAHNITSYTILYRSISDPSDQWMLHQTETAEERAIVTQLSDKSTYFFKVRPASMSEELSQESDKSEPIQTTVVVPSKPGRPKALSTTHNSVELEWSKPEQGANNVTLYTIFYRSASDPSDQWILNQTETAEERATVSKLSEKSTYFFKVRPESMSEELSQESDESEPIQTKLVIPSKPGKPRAMKVTDNSIELEWSKPEQGVCNIVSYTVFYHSTNDLPDKWNEIITNNYEKATLLNLLEKTFYTCKVQPSYDSGFGSESDVSEPIQTLLRLSVKNVIELAWDAREKWYFIGLQLGQKETDLSVIKKENMCDIGSCFTKMITNWLRKGEATWKKLVDALNHKTVGHPDLADSVCLTKNNSVTEVVPHSPVKPIIGELNSTESVFKCPLCGKCSVEKYLKRECPNFDSYSAVSFPYIEQENLTEDEQLKLHAMLMEETEKINDKFVHLVRQIRKSFDHEPCIDLQEMTYSIEDTLSLSSPLMASPEIKSASAIIKQLQRKRYISFFNYHIVQDLISNFGTDMDKKMLSTYEAEFKTFCERSVFEVPQAVFGPPPDNGEMLAFKVTDDMLKNLQSVADNDSKSHPRYHHTVRTSFETLNLSLNDILKIQRRIAKTLGIKNIGSLIFLGADKGCIELRFSVSGVNLDRIKQQKVDTLTELPGFTTLEAEGIHLLCGPPGKPYATDVTSDSIQLQWKKPEYQGLHQIQHYLIHYTSLNDIHVSAGWKTVQSKHFAEYLEIEGLTQNQSLFIFKVQAVDAIGAGIQSERSDPIHLRPLSVKRSYLNIGKPSKPRALNVTYDSVQLEWTKPEKDSNRITAYTILYRSTCDPPYQWMILRHASIEERVVVSQLLESATYHFLVQPEFEDGIGLESDISDPITMKRIIPSKPGKPRGLKVTHDSVQLEWSKPEEGAHNVTSYFIHYRSTSDPADCWTQCKAIAIEEGVVISQLRESTSYYFKIQPQYADGSGLESDISDPISTEMMIPSQPGKPRCVGISHDRIQIEWSKPEHGAHNITSYTILYHSTSDPHDAWVQQSVTSREESSTVLGLSKDTAYLFKVRPDCSDTFGSESDTSEPIKTMKEAPRKSRESAHSYDILQGLVQKMLSSEMGIPIRSHRRQLVSTIPSAFTGADIVKWLMRNLSIQSKAEAIHLANMLSKTGFIFCIEGFKTPMKDDGTLYRFQTPYYWPSQNPVDNDVEYSVFIAKQILHSRRRIHLLDYELAHLHKLKIQLAGEWKSIMEKADMDVKIIREQKKVAKEIIIGQETAFWRLRRPPPGVSRFCDITLTRLCTKRPEEDLAEMCTLKTLRGEMLFLQYTSKKTRVYLSTSLESAVNFCQRYREFDSMLTSPLPSNPWVSNVDTLWTIEKSILENPTEHQAKKWACSFQDLLTDVTGRFKFEKFCKNQFCLENVRFWQACCDLQSIPLTAVEGSVKLIYDEFLQHGSSSEVNFSANVREEIERDIKKPSRYIFTAAQEQIYQLMQNNIYPRFLNSQEYQTMLKKGKEMQPGGKGFFSKLQYGPRKSQLEANLKDATGISPNLPQRYARKQLSIPRRISGSSSGSLDDIFHSISFPTPNIPSDNKQSSSYTETFIDTISAPGSEKFDVQDQQSIRRVIAPINPPYHTPGSSDTSLDLVFEEGMGIAGGGIVNSVSIGNMMRMTHSAGDLQQLQEDTDTLDPFKWRKYARSL